MRRFYFLGGENVARKDSKDINTMAFEDAGGEPNVLVFPWARASFDSRFARRKRLTDYFRRLGACEVGFSDYSDSPGEIAAKVASADLLYLTGGQVSILECRMRAKGLDCLLRDFNGVVVGRSAGAIVLGKTCLVTNRYSGSRKTVKGIGLVDFSVKAHYLATHDGVLRWLSRKVRVYALPQSSALVVDRDTHVLTAVGDIVMFENGRKFSVVSSCS